MAAVSHTGPIQNVLIKCSLPIPLIRYSSIKIRFHLCVTCNKYQSIRWKKTLRCHQHREGNNDIPISIGTPDSCRSDYFTRHCFLENTVRKTTTLSYQNHSPGVLLVSTIDWYLTSLSCYQHILRTSYIGPTLIYRTSCGDGRQFQDSQMLTALDPNML